jgi:hypothetical protein
VRGEPRFAASSFSPAAYSSVLQLLLRLRHELVDHAHLLAEQRDATDGL